MLGILEKKPAIGIQIRHLHYISFSSYHLKTDAHQLSEIFWVFFKDRDDGLCRRCLSKLLPILDFFCTSQLKRNSFYKKWALTLWPWSWTFTV